MAVGIFAVVALAVALVFWPQAGPASANSLAGVVAVSAAEFHTCALTTGGGVKCWGYGAGGSTTPVDVVGLTSGVAAVSAALSHTCALTTGGGVKCWGSNLSGELGDGTTFPSTTPVDVCASGMGAGCAGGSPLTGVAAIAAGVYHTCALTIAGGVRCWGDNGHGELGDGTTTGRLTPVDVSGLTGGVAAVSAGGFHTCAVTTAGGAKCWGDNSSGQLGDGTTINRTSAVDVVGLTGNVVAIAAGRDHTCAVTMAGAAKCWGSDGNGQLGDGPGGGAFSLTPVNVSGLSSGVVSVAAGLSHTCAVITTSGLKCWGLNNNGQLGDAQGCGIVCRTPVNVSGLTTGVVSASAGTAHTCAVTTTGGAKCWGRNAEGQLGDGTHIGHSTPVDVVVMGPKPPPTQTPCPPAGCPTSTLTPTPTATATRTPCSFLGCPTRTSTPAGPPAMSLRVGGGVCDVPQMPTKCSVSTEGQFTLSVTVNSPPSQGYIAFQTQVLFGTLLYKPTVSAVEEIVWPDSADPVRNVHTPGVALHGALSGLIPPLPVSTFRGDIVTLRMNCPQPGAFRVSLAPYDPVTNPLGSNFSLPDGDTVPAQAELQINCVPAPTPTATATTQPIPRMQKLPALQNLFLTRQSTKIPPARCQDGTNMATLTESLSVPVTSADPKNPSQPQQLGGFSFQVKYDPLKVCVVLRAGAAWTANPQQICTVQDSVTAPTLQGVATIHCVTLGKATVVDTSTASGRTLATIEVRPQPALFNQIKPNQENGQIVQVTNEGCKLTDLQGHAIPVFSCESAEVTVRFLEGDVEPDCQINTLDTQSIAFRWGAVKGSLLFNDRFNLMPNPPLTDQVIDINDLQFVFGRFGSTCASPWPAQPPVNPKR